MYTKHEAYFEEYLSVVKGSAYTYFEALKECTSKSIDLAYLFDLTDDAVKLSSLCSRMEVRYDREWDRNPNTDDKKGIHFLYPVYQRTENDRGGKSEGTVLTRCLVNVVMHLAFSSLVGPSPLHSDNRDTFAINLFRFMLERHMPAQCIPSRTLIFDTFDLDGIVKPQTIRFETWDHPDYFQRCVADKMAWEKMELTEFKVDAWNYAAEDVLHMGPYIHTLQLLWAGRTLDKEIRLEPIPYLSYRAPEPVVGRIYPLFYKKNDGRDGNGILCIGPDGMTFAFVKTETFFTAAPLHSWNHIVKGLNCTVGPLVHRSNAVVNMNEHGLGLIMEHKESGFETEDFSRYEGWNDDMLTHRFHVEERYFFDSHGRYRIVVHGAADLYISAIAVHRQLLKLGTHLVVTIALLPRAYFRRMAHAKAPLLRTWLRYPEETTKGNPNLVYVCFRVMKTTKSRVWGVEIMGVQLDAVRLWNKDDEVENFMTPPPPEVLRRAA